MNILIYFQATIFETTGNQKKLVYKSPEIDVDEYDDHYYIVEPSQTTKQFLIEFVSFEKVYCYFLLIYSFQLFVFQLTT